jgi:hypothetical protein
MVGDYEMIEKPQRKYWYQFVYEECVLCGRYTEYKYRVYDRPRPAEYHKRHLYKQHVCGEHYL